MELAELLVKRQSERNYSPEKVSREEITRCLEAARIAPSACNSQPWKFVVIDDPEKVEAIAKATMQLGLNRFSAQVPVFVAVIQENMNFTAKVGSRLNDKDFSLIDMGLAVHAFCLQAAEIGLGTCIMGLFDEKKVKEMIDAPSNRRVQLLLALGHPTGVHREKIRKPLEEMSSWNEY